MRNMSLSNIQEWPLMTRLLICILVFFAVLYLGYRYDLSSQINKFAQNAQQEADLKQQLELIVSKNKKIKEEVSHLPKMQAELNNWQKQLVDYNYLPEVLNQILKLGADNHLFFSLFTPGDSAKVDITPKNETENKAPDAAAHPVAEAAPAEAPEAPIYFEKVPIKVVVIGNYHQIADFMSQVANLPWIVAIGNFTISNENSTALVGEAMAKQAAAQNLLSAEMTLDVYHTGESKKNEQN